MLLALISFELRRRLKMLSTYIYALILSGIGLFTMLASAGVFKSLSTSNGSERIHANSPVAVFENMTITALFGLFTVAAVFGQAATQDFTFGTWSIIFTRKLKKSTYVLGRFLGAFLFSAVLFAGIGAGQLLGALIAQLVDPSQLGAHRLDVYLWPYFTGVLPMLFLAGSVFFTLAALTRQMAPVYVGVVVLVLGYLVLSSALGDVQYRDLAAILDPFGLLAVDSMTRYWTPVERNQDLVPLAGMVLANRALWAVVGIALLGLTARLFRTTVDEQKGKGSAPADEATDHKVALPKASANPTFRSWLFTAFDSGLMLFREVVRSPVYWSFVVAGLTFALMAIFFSSRSLFGTATLPVTYQALELTGGTFTLFSLITITFYSGELVWRERDAGVADIVFASRVPGWVPFTSKVVGLVLVASSIQLVAGVAALLSQVGQGYFDIEPRLYFTELVVFGALQDVTLCVLAVTVQVLVNHKYLGHAVMVGYYASGIVMRLLGIEERLLRFGSEPNIQYSDMNGYGHWVGAALTYRAFWYAVSGMLLAIAALFSVRSRETGAKHRIALAKQKIRPVWVASMLALALVSTALGGFLFYRTHLAHRYRTSKDQERLQADYEKQWKSWADKPTPRIISADVNFDLYPTEAEPRLTARGTYLVQNKTSEPIAEVLISLPTEARVNALALGTASVAKTHASDLGLFVYALTPPLEPGAELPLTFDLEFVSTALKHGTKLTQVVGNGTFLDNFMLPQLGYQTDSELTEDGDRKSYGLAPKENLPDRDDLKARQNSYIRKDSDFIRLRATVSTVPDQIAVVPGTLEKEWTENGRRYFTYVMDQPILNFFSVLSARYEVLRDQWRDVKLEIYFHPTHRADLERMMTGMKDSLAYCSEAFGPYQHTQARILEFPRYQSFAQSFPNTIPYSEAVGFIARVRDTDPDDIDYPYYITAHEIAHQWWGHQVVGAHVQGATMTSETLAQYSALMVMKKKFGEKKMRRFLKYELDRYLIGRVLERKKEQPLAKNEYQLYIHYQKGSLAMYALQHFIGEDHVNAGLKKYVAAVKFQGPPYTNSTELLSYLKAETPPEYAYLIDDLFETITIYDNRTVSASMKQNAQGSWDVTIKVKAVKYRVDEKGTQTDIEFSDFIDVGALDDKGEAIFLEPRRVSKGDSELTFTVPTKPARVGLDPINLLVDRTSDDNTTVPTVAE